VGKTIGVVGAGSWATALSVLLAGKGYTVKMWSRRDELARNINENRENSRYLPGVNIPPNIKVCTVLEHALRGAEVVVFGVPSHVFREVLRVALPHLPSRVVLVNVAKGIEEQSLCRMSEVFAGEAGELSLIHI